MGRRDCYVRGGFGGLIQRFVYSALESTKLGSSDKSLPAGLPVLSRPQSEIGAAWAIGYGWVRNDGNVRAEEVQVFALNLYSRMRRNSLFRWEGFPPMNLRWRIAKTGSIRDHRLKYPP